MLGRLRVLLILGLVISPVTADLRHGFLWSEASAKKTYSPFVLPLLYWFYPQCSFGWYKDHLHYPLGPSSSVWEVAARLGHHHADD
jgi:hypothetical protein